MAGGPGHGHDDFLQKEVQESNTEESRKSETLRILEETAKICEQVGDSEKAAQIRKDCEDVRQVTINALKGVYNETHGKLAEIKTELSEADKENLSEGEISEYELSQIRQEAEEVRNASGELGETEKSTFRVTDVNSLIYIRDKDTLLETYGEIMTNHEDIQEEMRLSDISPNLLNDPEVILDFPGKLHWNDILLINMEHLGDEAFVKELLSRENLDYMTVNRILLRALNALPVNRLYKIYGNIFQDLSESEKKEYGEKIPKIIVGLDPDQVFTGYVKKNQAHPSDIGSADELIEFFGIKAIREYRAAFVEMIKAGGFSKSDYFKYAIGGFPELAKQVLTKDPKDIQYFPVELRNSSEIITHLLKSIKTQKDIKSLKFIVVDTPEGLVNVYRSISQKFQKNTVQDFLKLVPNFRHKIRSIRNQIISDGKDPNTFYESGTEECKVLNVLFHEAVGSELDTARDYIKGISIDKQVINTEIQKYIDTQWKAKGLNKQQIEDVQNILHSNDIESRQDSINRITQIMGEDAAQFLKEISSISVEMKEKSINERKVDVKLWKKCDKKVQALLEENKGRIDREKLGIALTIFLRTKGKIDYNLIEKYHNEFMSQYKMTSPQREKMKSLLVSQEKKRRGELMRDHTEAMMQAAKEGKLAEYSQRKFQEQVESGNMFSPTEKPETPNTTDTSNTPSPSETTGEIQTKQTLINKGINIEYITKEEFQTISDSQEALTNFIDFHQKLSDLNLQHIWPIRETIFTQIGNKYDTGGFDTTDNNYLSPSEVSIFLYTIMYSVKGIFKKGKYESRIESLKGNKQDIEKIEPLMRELQDIGGLTEKKDESLLNGGGIGKVFLDTYTERDKGSGLSANFKTGEFQDAISGM